MTFHDHGYLGQGIHAHGTRANYKAGCRCLACRSANAAYEATRARARASGKPSPGQAVQSYKVRRCLRSLLAEGFTLQALAVRVGLHRETLGIHARLVPTNPDGQIAQPAPKMRISSAARILALYRLMMDDAQS